MFVVTALLENMLQVKMSYFVLILSYLFYILCINSFLSIWHTFFQLILVLSFAFCMWENFCQGGWMVCQKNGSQNLKQSLHCVIWCLTFYSKAYPTVNTIEMLQQRNLGSQLNILLNSFLLSYFFIGGSIFHTVRPLSTDIRCLGNSDTHNQ